MSYTIHPIANVFPMMSEAEFAALKEDMEKYGQREPVVLWRDQLVDGRNRLRACEELGLDLNAYELSEDDDPVAWAVSCNMHRRHLSESQRAMVAAKLATLTHGGNRKSDQAPNLALEKSLPDQAPNLALEKAAEMLNVSTGSTKAAKNVLAKGADEVHHAVEQGKLPVSVASDFVKAVPDKTEQAEIVSKGTDVVRQTVAQSRESRIKDSEDGHCVNAFLLVWDKANAAGKQAIWLWLCDNYQAAN